jgi:hypothetical protein
MKNLKTPLLLIISVLSLLSCSNEDVHTDEANGKSYELVAKTREEVISATNFEILKQQSLASFNSQNIGAIFSTPTFDLVEVNHILSGYTEEEIKHLDFEAELGEEYDPTYFENLDKLMNFTTRIYTSNLFYQDSSLDSRVTAVNEVLEYVFIEGGSYVTNGCGPSYNTCIRQAERSHKLRIAAATASAGLGMLVSGWTGVGAAGSAGAWVIAVIASGVQYQIDSDACTEYYC